MKRFSVLVLAFVMFLLASSCMARREADYTVKGYSSTKGIIEAVTDDKGRATGGYQRAFIGDTLSTMLFDYKVIECTFSDTYGSSLAGDGKRYLIVTIDMTNTSGSDITLCEGDFLLAYDMTDLKLADEAGISAGAQEGLPAYDLKAHETVALSAAFEVPSEAQPPFSLIFTEFYSNEGEDDTPGNSFYVIFDKVNGQHTV
ncbi:MAG: DUF4352 domain-containing protein [Eubacteriaceae bacterium]|nr:DUF4352 domain-containing protein [Eubacteriaceae bacterium]